MAIIGGWQIGPFEIDFQKGGTLPAFEPIAFQTDFQQGLQSQFVLANYVGQDWYAASYKLFVVGLNQVYPPIQVTLGKRQLVPPGQVLAQIPFAGALMSPGGNVQLTVATENLLGVNFALPLPNG